MRAFRNMVVVSGARATTGVAVVADHRIRAVCPDDEIPADCDVVDLGGAILAPGFVDLQVNGGGGVLVNDDPTVDGLRRVAQAHRRLGTTSLLATVITDTPDVAAAAVASVRTAVENGEPGIAGIHLEGPFLNPARCGAHDPGLMRRMRRRDVDHIPTPHQGMAVMVTVAPEMVDPGCIAALSARGVVVAVGHTRASSAEMARAVAEGATCVTHLFNAMDPPLAREPGAVGAALDTVELWASLIADGHHVDDRLLRLALRAKPDRCLLVSDAMPPVGVAPGDFVVAGEHVTVVDGVCRRGDGVLAGSAISMSDAVRYLVAALGVAPPVALRMASADPARVIGADGRLGHIAVGQAADMVVLDPGDLRVVGVISAGGRPVGETAFEQA